MGYALTEIGKKKVEWFIRECAAKSKEILDAGFDTADETELPTVEDIVSDINWDGVDEEGEYYNSWGITDNCSSDCCFLTLGIDFDVAPTC